MREQDLTRGGFWSHLRKRFFEALHHHPVVAHLALGTLKDLFLIERELKGRPPDEVLATRAARSQRLVDGYFAWSKAVSQTVRPESLQAKALQYDGLLERVVHALGAVAVEEFVEAMDDVEPAPWLTVDELGEEAFGRGTYLKQVLALEVGLPTLPGHRGQPRAALLGAEHQAGAVVARLVHGVLARDNAHAVGEEVSRSPQARGFGGHRVRLVVDAHRGHRGHDDWQTQSEVFRKGAERAKALQLL